MMPNTPDQSDAGSTSGDPVIANTAPQDTSAAHMQGATGAALAPERETALQSKPVTANTPKVQSAAAAAAPLGVRSGRSTAGNRLSRILARWRHVRGVQAAGTAFAALAICAVHTHFGCESAYP